VISLGGETIVDVQDGWRVCETSHPPVYYVDRRHFAPGSLIHGGGGSYCEFKGDATYWHVCGGGVRRDDAGWSYEDPTGAFGPLCGAVAVYPGQMDEVLLDGEPATLLSYGPLSRRVAVAISCADGRPAVRARTVLDLR